MIKRTMQAAVLKEPVVLKIEEIPIYPFTTQDEILLEVEACGICGSDLRYYKGENPWALHTLGEERPNPPNIVMGHEYAGSIVEVNSRANEDLIGKRVGVLCFKVCGRCHFCLTGRENLCKNTIHIGHGQGWGVRDYYPGAYAKYCLAWSSLAYLLPEHISSEEAAMLDILAVGLHVAKSGSIRPGGTVFCFGCGPAGNAIMQAAKTLGAARTIIADTSQAALNIAEKCGADVIIDTNRDDIISVVMKETNNQGVCSVYDSVGTNDSLNTSLKLLDGGGTYVNMAVHQGKISFPGLAISGERSIRTSSNFCIFEFQVSLDYLASRIFNVKPWITHSFSLEEIQKAFDLLLSSEKSVFKVVIFSARN